MQLDIILSTLTDKSTIVDNRTIILSVLFYCDAFEERLVLAKVGISKPYSDVNMSSV